MPAARARRVFCGTRRYDSRDDFVAATYLRSCGRMRDRNRRLLRRRWNADCGSDFVTRCDVIAEREFVSDVGADRVAHTIADSHRCNAHADAESICVCV